MFKSITLMITSKCNLSCPHCYTPKNIREMDNDTILRFLKDARKEGMEYVCLTGGEPLLRKGFSDLLSQIKDVEYQISIFTNGILLNKSIAQLLSKFKVLVNVSVDGAIPSVAESIRGLGNFKKIIRSLEILKKEKVFFTTVFCMTKLNLYDSPNFIKFSLMSGARYTTFIPIIPNEVDTFDLLPDKESFKKVILEVKNKATQLKYKVHLWCAPFLLSLSSKYFKVWPCNLKSINIDSEGYVRLCDTLDFRLANIKGKTLNEIKNEYLCHPIVRKLMNERGKACRKCSFVKKCHGGCWSRAFWKYESFSQVDPLCFFYYKYKLQNHIKKAQLNASVHSQPTSISASEEKHDFTSM